MFFKSYTQRLLESGDITGFVEGIMRKPGQFFHEAQKDPAAMLRTLAGVLDLARSPIGQSATLLSITAALKVAAKDTAAPDGAEALAQKLSDELLRIFKAAK